MTTPPGRSRRLAAGARHTLGPVALAAVAIGGVVVAAPSSPVQAEVATATLVPTSQGAVPAVLAPPQPQPGSPAATTTTAPRLPSPDPVVAAEPPPPPAPVWVRPAPGRASSHYGPRWGRVHSGLDLASPTSTPIVAAGDGVVLFAGRTSGYGTLVLIEHENGDVTAYGHMSEILATTGQVVSAGTEIAKVGSEGVSTGPHLHFEVRAGGQDGPKVDPEPWLADRGVVIDAERLAVLQAAAGG